MAAQIATSQSSLQWGTLDLSQSPTIGIPLLVYNTGDATLTGTLSFPSTGPEFTASTLAISVAPGGSQQVIISFAPTADGVFSGVLLIASNDPITPQTIIPVGGAASVPPPYDNPQQPPNYDHSKSGIGAVYPVNAIADAWGVVEPLVTPDQLRARHLFGIPLVSYQADPITGKRQVMTDPILKDFIDRAVAEAELETHLDIFPKVRREKHAFDRQSYAALGYMMLDHKPIQSLEKLAVVASNNSDLYDVPPSWVETAYLHTGQINIIPMTIAFQYGGFFVPSNSPNGGSAFLAILGQNPWIPAYWQLDYTTGFKDGQFPQIINELIGIMASIEILASLATTNARNSSHSVGIDALSQSISTPGPQIYDARIALLQERKQTLINKLRAKFGTKLFTTHL